MSSSPRFTFCVTFHSGKKVLPTIIGGFKLIEQLAPWPEGVLCYESPYEALAVASRVIPPQYISRCQIIDEEGNPAPRSETFI